VLALKALHKKKMIDAAQGQAFSLFTFAAVCVAA